MICFRWLRDWFSSVNIQWCEWPTALVNSTQHEDVIILFAHRSVTRIPSAYLSQQFSTVFAMYLRSLTVMVQIIPKQSWMNVFPNGLRLYSNHLRVWFNNKSSSIWASLSSGDFAYRFIIFINLLWWHNISRHLEFHHISFPYISMRSNIVLKHWNRISESRITLLSFITFKAITMTSRKVIISLTFFKNSVH